MSNKIVVDCEEGMERPSWADRLVAFAGGVLGKLGIENWDLSILLCRDPFIANLNREYRQIDGPTDVLSFEQGDEYVDDSGVTWLSAGDIVVSVDSLLANSRDFGVSPDEELKRLVIHGILHLDGMDHATNDPREEMLERQEDILRSFGGTEVYES